MLILVPLVSGYVVCGDGFVLRICQYYYNIDASTKNVVAEASLLLCYLIFDWWILGIMT